MKVGIIGAGRVGTAFALALSGSGTEQRQQSPTSSGGGSPIENAASGEIQSPSDVVQTPRASGARRYSLRELVPDSFRYKRLFKFEISGVFSRTPQDVDFISNKLGKPFLNNFSQVIKGADIVLLTVPDSRIANIAAKIHEDCASDICSKTFLHCSGALTSAELMPLRQDGCCLGSLHPIQTFASKEDGWKGMRDIFFGFEGSVEAREKALELVRMLNGTLLDIKSEAKPLYHAAACILSNYTVALSHVSGMLLDAVGIGKDLGIKAFMPLLKNTVNNIAVEGSLKALTGPIARGDCITVAGHLSALDNSNGDISELYRGLGKITVQMAFEKGSINKAKAGLLLEILK